MAKKTHAAVNYRTGTASKHCQICSMYISRKETKGAPRCTAVQDPIQPSGVCNIFERKGK
jgi:hypothetical protein